MTCAAAYITLSAALYFFQDHLVFPGANTLPENIEKLKTVQPQSPITYHRGDVSLQGWHIQEGDHKPLILYYGGNAEDISYRALQFSTLTDYQSVLINYRGYGGSTGHPSEKLLYQDALMIYDDVVSFTSPTKIFVIGRSLGTGVATYIASQRRVDALVLITPYDSIAAIGQARYPLAPVRLLLKHSFDSLSRASALFMPTLVMMSEVDEVVPHAHTNRLIEELPAVKKVKILDGVDHGDIGTSPEFLPEIVNFLDSYQEHQKKSES